MDQYLYQVSRIRPEQAEFLKGLSIKRIWEFNLVDVLEEDFDPPSPYCELTPFLTSVPVINDTVIAEHIAHKFCADYRKNGDAIYDYDKCTKDITTVYYRSTDGSWKELQISNDQLDKLKLEVQYVENVNIAETIEVIHWKDHIELSRCLSNELSQTSCEFKRVSKNLMINAVKTTSCSREQFKQKEDEYLAAINSCLEDEDHSLFYIEIY